MLTARKFLSLLWGLLLYATCLSAQAQVTSAGQTDERLNLLYTLTYLEDPSNRLSYEEIQHPTHQKRFKPWSGNGTALNFGLSQSDFWIRFSLRKDRDASSDWYLEIPNPLLAEISLHDPQGAIVRSGIDFPLRERPSFNRHFVFPIQLQQEPRDFYLKVSSVNPLHVPIFLWKPYAYQRHLHWQMLGQFVYFGCLLTLLLCNAILSVVLRDKRFLFYSLYSLSMGFAMFAGNGFAGIYFWPDWNRFDQVAQTALLSLTVVFATRLAQHLLEIPRLMPKLNFLLQAGVIASAVLIVGLMMHVWVTDMPLALIIWIFMFVSLTQGVLILFISVRIGRHQGGSPRYFAIGWAILWAGAVTGALHALGVVPSNSVTAYALQISTVGEMLFLAFSLGSRVYEERQQLLAAQRQVQASQDQLVEVLRSSEAQLEQTVQDRTDQLLQSLERERSVLQEYVRFGSMIAHEVRNPVYIIQSQISLWHKEKSLSIDHTQQRFGIIQTALSRLMNLFEKWLQSDRLKSSEIQLSLQTIELQGWLENWLPGYKMQLPDHHLIWSWTKNPCHLTVDTTLIEIAITNLIENAAKYSEKGSAIHVRIRSKDTDHVGICVDDQGEGIAEEHREKIFDEFFRPKMETNKPGIGLGLAIVRKIAELHQGHVELAHNPEGPGSSFCIWLPKAGQ